MRSLTLIRAMRYSGVTLCQLEGGGAWLSTRQLDVLICHHLSVVKVFHSVGIITGQGGFAINVALTYRRHPLHQSLIMAVVEHAEVSKSYCKIFYYARISILSNRRFAFT